MSPVTPILTADGSHTLHSERYGETFHSVNGAVTESRHVFLQASGVADRLAEQKSTRVLEIGFGLGLNCLMSADLACDKQAKLDYHAIENDPSVFQLFSAVHYHEQLNNPQLHENLLDGLNAIAPRLSMAAVGMEPIRLSLSNDITLTLHLADAISDELPPGPFDALYLDAFSPDSNPECWSTEFLAKLHSRMASGGALTTYSAKGSVRRALMAAGFDVKKLPGPPGKREMLHATC